MSRTPAWVAHNDRCMHRCSRMRSEFCDCGHFSKMASNGRGYLRSGRSPPFLVVSLLVVICILAYNYWNSASSNSELRNSVSDLEDRLRLYNLKKTSLEKRNDALITRVRETDRQLEDSKAKFSSKDSELSAIRSQLLESQDQLDKIRQEKGTLESDASGARKELDSLQARFQELQGEHNLLQDQMKQQQQDTDRKVQEKLEFTSMQCKQQMDNAKVECDRKLRDIADRYSQLQDLYNAARQNAPDLAAGAAVPNQVQQEAQQQQGVVQMNQQNLAANIRHQAVHEMQQQLAGQQELPGGAAGAAEQQGQEGEAVEGEIIAQPGAGEEQAHEGVHGDSGKGEAVGSQVAGEVKVHQEGPLEGGDEGHQHQGQGDAVAVEGGDNEQQGGDNEQEEAKDTMFQEGGDAGEKAEGGGPAEGQEAGGQAAEERVPAERGGDAVVQEEHLEGGQAAEENEGDHGDVEYNEDDEGDEDHADNEIPDDEKAAREQNRQIIKEENEDVQEYYDNKIGGPHQAEADLDVQEGDGDQGDGTNQSGGGVSDSNNGGEGDKALEAAGNGVFYDNGGEVINADKDTEKWEQGDGQALIKDEGKGEGNVSDNHDDEDDDEDYSDNGDDDDDDDDYDDEEGGQGNAQLVGNEEDYDRVKEGALSANSDNTDRLDEALNAGIDDEDEDYSEEGANGGDGGVLPGDGDEGEDDEEEGEDVEGGDGDGDDDNDNEDDEEDEDEDEQDDEPEDQEEGDVQMHADAGMPGVEERVPQVAAPI